MLEQARNQHLRFGGSEYILGEKDFCFYLYVLIKHFLRTIKFGRPKIFGGTTSECPPWLRACAGEILLQWEC